MRTGYGTAALLGVVILAAGAVGAVLIDNNAKPGTELLSDNLFLLCLVVAALGFLIVLTAGIGLCVYLLGRTSTPDQQPAPEAPAGPTGETDGTPPGFIGVTGDSLDA
jgi:hypothetical protein